MNKEFDNKIRKAALKFLDYKELNVIAENFRGWIIVKEPLEDGYNEYIFIKILGDYGQFKPCSHYKLREEFEETIVAWLQAVDPDDCLGPIRGDVMNFNADDNDRAILRWEKDAVGMR